MILDMMDKAVNRVRELGFKPVYASLYGSQNYGLDVYQEDHASDYDFKVVVMPGLFDMVFRSDRVSMSVNYEGGQVDIKSAVAMTEIYGKMNQQYLETLVTPFYKVYEGGEYMEQLRVSLPELMKERATLFVNSVVGHYKAKASKVFLPGPSGIPDYDPKNAYHMLRLVCMLEDYRKTGKLVLLPPAQEKELLIQVKLHRVPQKDLYQYTGDWDIRLQHALDMIAPTLGEVKDDVYNRMMKETKGAWYNALLSDGMNQCDITKGNQNVRNEKDDA